MHNYIAFKVLHVLMAFALVGPLMLTPRWLHLARHEVGRSALLDLHRLAGISGWLVLISGAVMLILQRGAMLLSLWMQCSIAIFIVVQVFDHFWADRREEEIEQNPQASTSVLKAWLVTKLGLYVAGSSLKCNFDECLKEQAAAAFLPFSNTTYQRSRNGLHAAYPRTTVPDMGIEESRADAG